jgi:ribosomal protein S18 acetylase RimI-like enzyme
MWEKLVDVHEEAETLFRLRPGSSDMWRIYLETRLLRDPDTRLLVATEGTQVLGFLVARVEHPAPMFAGEFYGFVSDSYVRPEYRRKGITTALFNKAIRWFANQGVNELQLDVYNRNTAAYEYWAKRGFRSLKTRMVRAIDPSTT